MVLACQKDTLELTLRDYFFCLAWESLGVPSEELEVAGGWEKGSNGISD